MLLKVAFFQKVRFVFHHTFWKKATFKRAYVNKGCNLENTYALTVFFFSAVPPILLYLIALAVAAYPNSTDRQSLLDAFGRIVFYSRTTTLNGAMSREIRNATFSHVAKCVRWRLLILRILLRCVALFCTTNKAVKKMVMKLVENCSKRPYKIIFCT